MSNFQEKLKVRYFLFFFIFNYLPVPETDTGREVEYTKERERTLFKELGKIAL